MYYVTMTDRVLSGWGKSDEKINKLVFVCEGLTEARIVADNAKARGDQKHINICTTKPYYSPNTHYTQIKSKDIYPSWYIPGFFKQR